MSADAAQRIMDESRFTKLTEVLRCMTRLTNTTTHTGEILKSQDAEAPEVLAQKVVDEYGLRGFEFVIRAKAA